MKRIVTGAITGMALVVGAGLAQAPPGPAFEVASIRAASLPTPETMRGGQFRAGMEIDGASVNWGFASLSDLLSYAFRVKAYQISGPAWMPQSRFNVLAKLPQGASPDQVPDMMQGLLVERFKLAVHHENREQPVYELVVAKGGPKLEPSTETTDGAAQAPDANANAPGFLPGLLGGGLFRGGPGNATQVQDGRGGRGAVIAGGPEGTTRISAGENCAIHLDIAKLSLKELADTLSPFLDKPVVDGTGLTGNYKITLDLPLEVMFGMIQNTMRTAGLPPPGQGGFGGGPGGRGPGDGGGRGDGPGGGRGGFLQGCDPGAALGNSGDTSNAPIFQAVQKLGLRLQARKAPFDTIVVDHLEKTPSDN